MSLKLSWLGRAGTLARRIGVWGARVWLPVALFAIVALLVSLWWLGPGWTWKGQAPLAPLPMRLALSLVLVVVPLTIWGAVMRFRYHRLRDEQLRQLASQQDPLQAAEDAQQRSLDGSLQLLRCNLRRRNYLYALPWYVVIGQEGSGKTSFINRSSQSFSLSGVDRAAAERSTADSPALAIDWWISNDAVVIDPAGELICQKQYRSVGGQPGPDCVAKQERVHAFMQEHPDAAPRLWRHFVAWLGKNRPRRPLNGAILMVDLSLLLVQQPSDRKALALLIRSRLRELMEELGTRLPVYIVLSKFDMVRGFDTFFAGLPSEVREASLGFTCTLSSVDDFDAWLQELSQQYDSFVERLNEQIFDAMAERSTEGEREDLYVFSRQVSGLKPLLFMFLSEILESDRYSTPALVRGMYFASVFQQGIPANALGNAVGRTYGLPLPAGRALPPGKASSYFTHRLFQKMIYPEAGLAGDNIRVLERKRRALWINAACALLVTLGAVGGWHYQFQQNRQKVHAVLDKSRSFNATGIERGQDTSGRNLLPALDQIRDAVSVYEDYRTSWPHVAGLGLYQGHDIGPKVDAAYMQLLGQQFLPQLAEGVVAGLDDAPPGSDRRLAALRVYRMIEDRANRKPEYVESWMAGAWQQAFPGDAETQNRLMSHLRYALTYVDARLPSQPRGVKELQAELRQIPLPHRVYAGMKREALDTLPASLDLRAEIGPVADVLYKPPTAEQARSESHSHINPLLTAEGFHGYFLRRTKAVEALALTDQWTLGYRAQSQYSEEDRRRLAAQIRELYADDYIANWRRGLNSLKVNDFQDLDHGVLVLEQVIGPTQPLRRLIESVARNSHLDARPGALDTGAERAAAAAEDAPSVRRIEREFSALAQLLGAKEGQMESIADIQREISVLHDYMRGIQISTNRGEAALDALSGRTRREGVDPIFLVRQMATGLPEPLNRHVATLADESERTLALEAVLELERRWEEDVHGFYRQRLAGRYPLEPASTQNIDLDDFEAFFGPKGRLQGFQDSYLTPLLSRNSAALATASAGEALITPELGPQIEQAQRIRQAFFNERGGLGVQFNVQPLALSATHLNSVLNVDGQLISYAHGPRTVTGLIWPNALRDGVESRLTLVGPAGQTRVMRHQGPWALFRLLSQAQLNGSTLSSVDLSSSAGTGAVRYRITSDRTGNPFTQQVFNEFNLPRSLRPKMPSATTPRAPLQGDGAQVIAQPAQLDAQKSPSNREG
ncbi:type VI secretion system membrane subunit TssM [Stenotrophomonas maltophilia]|nr:type VI secretion system membrane subunit TssM [Stenotrophomonas maltophilia]